MARVSFSPTTEPMLPPRKPNSKTHSTTGWPPRRATPVTTASSIVVFCLAAFRRSRYRLVSLKLSGSTLAMPVSYSSKVPASTRSAMRSREEMRKG